METLNTTVLLDQITALGNYVNQVMDCECSISVHQDGSIMIETDLGVGFGYDSILEMYDDLENIK